jgi:hypothetical protein
VRDAITPQPPVLGLHHVVQDLLIELEREHDGAAAKPNPGVPASEHCREGVAWESRDAQPASKTRTTQRAASRLHGSHSLRAA